MGAPDHGAGFFGRDGRRGESHVLGQLQENAAAAGHHDEAHLGIAMQAQHKLQSAADVLAHQHGVELLDAGAPTFAAMRS